MHVGVLNSQRKLGRLNHNNHLFVENVEELVEGLVGLVLVLKVPTHSLEGLGQEGGGSFLGQQVLTQSFEALSNSVYLK